MRIMRIVVALVAVTAVVALTAVAAAGGGSSGPERAAPAQERDIVDTAVAAGSFGTLAKLLTRADLVDTLKGEGPYTVFAPTDAAFAKVPKRTLKSLKRNRAKLRAVLLYHVAAGRLEASDVVERSSIKTLNGKRVRIRVANSKVFVNRARVTTPDVGASNGVIHVINRVLIPHRR
jgi:uncharacterized surface protein with fasciclin (FAS1) repeats